MLKRGKIALTDYDRQKQIDDEYKQLQKSVEPIANTKVEQPTAPTAPSLKAETSDGQLEVSGVADAATVRIVVAITGQGAEDITTDEDGNQVDNTVRVNFTETITTGLPDYAVEISEPTIEVNITSTAYNKIDDEAEATTTWTPASGGE